ncbi:helix-turn-helix domain-containing protein [Salinibacterium sp. ZJ454]|uniref:helix-turn-helix domain-containing protein n=1 Tax=Salinibacterium sp. ZJ454 TaxID=2708339 RepID=UPI0014216A34|nr:helix-turn-helix domain-containing protein [Salinibacterium sp. ZJ454]
MSGDICLQTCRKPVRAAGIVSAVILEGRSKAEVARDYGVARSWVHVLVARYLEGGWAALEPRPRTPKSNPRRISAALKAEIVQSRHTLTRQGHDAGAHTSTAHLERRRGSGLERQP